MSQTKNTSALIEKPKRKKWTLDLVKGEAQKYASRSAFKNGSHYAYYQARKLGLLDSICAHMSEHVVKPTKWDLDALKAEAQKFNCKTAFRYTNPYAYYQARKLGMIDSICTHMSDSGADPQIWNSDALKVEAQKFNCRISFRKNSPYAYYRAGRLGLLASICAHMPKYSAKPTKWDFDTAKAEALKFNSRMAFENGSPGAYHQARKSGWLDSICSHMPSCNNRKITKELILSEAMKFQTRSEFFNGAASLYNSAKKLGLFDEATEHMQKVFTYWTEDLILAEAAKYSTTVEFMANCSKGYWAAKRHGLLDKVRSLYGQERITKEKCLAVAAQFKNRKEFEKAAPTYHRYASYHEFLDEACQHMQPLRINWTPESVKAKAAEYRSLKEFRRQCKKGYAYAKKHGLLDTLLFSDVIPGQ